MSPRDYVLWLNGAIGMIGDRLPTELEWQALKEKNTEMIGSLVADKFTEQMDEYKRKIENSMKQSQLALGTLRGYATTAAQTTFPYTYPPTSAGRHCACGAGSLCNCP